MLNPASRRALGAVSLSPLMALSIALLVPSAPALASADVPSGYEITTPDGGLQLAFEGETVFETAPSDLLIAANVTGPHDMTGDGILNLVVFERIGRSTASLTVFSLAPAGPQVLMQTTGMAHQMRGFENISEDTDLSGLLGLAGMAPPQPDAEPEADPAPETDGHWLTAAGSWEEGFSAKLGWVVPEYSETEFATMLFRCPENGDPFWVEPLLFHDTREEIPEQIVLALDGTEWPLRVMPQYDDAMMEWYAIGTFDRDSGLFAALADARQVTLHYPGMPAHEMHGGGISSGQRAEIKRFEMLCSM